jgi:arylsulfatase A-like enzyme
MPKQPNFVLFITDQQRVDYLGCYGHPILKTPNIDRIAKDGTAFDKFYVASPVCMPNRASLMTGRMPSVHGVRSNGIPLSTGSTTFVDLLAEAGYQTALIGKSHLQNFNRVPPFLKRGEARAGFHEPSAPKLNATARDYAEDGYNQEHPARFDDPDGHVATPFYGFGHVELVTGHGDNVGGDYRRWLREKNPKAPDLLGPKAALPHDYICPQAHRTAIPEELYSSAYIGERAAAYLGERSEDDAPFFLMVSFPDPHHPFNPPGKYWDLYKPEQFSEPEAYSRNDWTPPPHVAAAMAERAAGEANLKGMGTISISGCEALEAQALTCGMIACVDDAIGGVLDALANAGLGDDTITMFTADHGDHLGDQQLLLKGAEQYQSILRVPMIWSDPQTTDQPARSAAIASSIDIPATILERARIEPFNGLQGQSMLGVVTGETEHHRDAAFVQYDHQRVNPSLGVPPRVHSLVDAGWRMSLYHGAAWGELYDLANDPGEFDNLWDAPSAASKKAELLERLSRAEIEHIDRSPMPISMA